jgi:hypothetical protein
VTIDAISLSLASGHCSLSSLSLEPQMLDTLKADKNFAGTWPEVKELREGRLGEEDESHN